MMQFSGTRRRFISIFGMISGIFASLMFVLPAQAVPFNFNGTCTDKCAEVGLSVGDSWTGFIDVKASSVVPGGALTSPDVIDFSFTVGIVSIDFASAAAFELHAFFDPGTTTFSSIQFVASEAIVPDRGEIFRILVTDPVLTQASIEGFCDNAECLGSAAFDPAVLSINLNPTDVPEPSTAALFGIAVIFLIHVRLRSRLRNAIG
jgi:hypothetical protein